MMVTSQLYNTTELTEVIGSGGIDNILKDLYIDKSQLEYQRKRYINALNRFTQLYGEGDVLIFSAPGRSEIGGNHTDHQNGKVLAASINLDIIAIVRPVNSKDSMSEEGSLSGHSGVNAGIIRIVSDNYPMIEVALSDTDINKEEYSTTKALVKGVTAGFKKNGFKTGALDAFITSDVPMGAGLSSSAAFEQYSHIFIMLEKYQQKILQLSDRWQRMSILASLVDLWIRWHVRLEIWSILILIIRKIQLLISLLWI